MGRISREGCRFSLRPSRARPSPSRWRPVTPSMPQRPRSRTRRESLQTRSDISSQASSLRMAAPFRTTTSRRSRPSTLCFASKELAHTSPILGRSPQRYALEVEEEEDASPPTQAQEDASALQVNLNLLRSRKSCWCSKIFCCAEPSTREINCTLPGYEFSEQLSLFFLCRIS